MLGIVAAAVIAARCAHRKARVPPRPGRPGLAGGGSRSRRAMVGRDQDRRGGRGPDRRSAGRRQRQGVRRRAVDPSRRQRGRARIATAEAQIALRKRARNDQSTSSRAARTAPGGGLGCRREHGVFDAQLAVDQAATARAGGAGVGGRPHRGAGGECRASRTGSSQRQSELRTLEDDKNTPLPTLNEGQLNVARAELLLAQAGIDKLTVRAPMAGTVCRSMPSRRIGVAHRRPAAAVDRRHLRAARARRTR